MSIVKSKQIRIGIVGFGEWGPNHVRNFARLPNARVMGIVDRRTERLRAARQQFKGIPTFSSPKELLDGAPVDALVVATPTSTHAEIVRTALERGIHVLCEKPLCSDLEQGQELVRLADSKHLVLMVGHVFLFNSGIVKLRQLIREKEVGAVHYLACRRTNLGPIREDVNAVWDLASHDVSIANYLLGALPEKVSAIGHAYLRPDVQDVAFATLSYPDNVLVHLHVSWLNPVKVREITAVGDRKMVTWNDLAPAEPIRIYDKGVIKERHYTDFSQFQVLTREGDAMIPRVAPDEPLFVQDRTFLDALGGTAECLSDGRFAVDVMKVLVAIDRSMAMGGCPVPIERVDG
jgi:predicted dehydrogenase